MKIIKYMIAALALSLVPTFTAWGGSSDAWYAEGKARIASGSPSGSGTVYVTYVSKDAAAPSTPADSSYVTSKDAKSESSKGASYDFYFYAKPANADCKFLGWSETEGKTDLGTASPYKMMITAPTASGTTPKTLYALFSRTTTLTFLEPANGSITATAGGSELEVPGAIVVSDIVTMTATANEGYKVFGWYTEDASGNKTYFSYSSTNSTAFAASAKLGATFVADSAAVEVSTLADLETALAGTALVMVVPSTAEISIGSGKSLTVPAGRKLVVEGALRVEGTFTVNGCVEGTGKIIKGKSVVTQDPTVHEPVTKERYEQGMPAAYFSWPCYKQLSSYGLTYQVTTASKSEGTIKKGTGSVLTCPVMWEGEVTDVGTSWIDISTSMSDTHDALVCNVDTNVAFNHIVSVRSVHTKLGPAVVSSNSGGETGKFVVMLANGSMSMSDFPSGSGWQSTKSKNGVSSEEDKVGKRPIFVDCAGYTCTASFEYNNSSGCTTGIYMNSPNMNHSGKITRARVRFFNCDVAYAKLNTGSEYESRVEVFDCGSYSSGSEGGSNDLPLETKTSLIWKGGSYFYSGGPYSNTFGINLRVWGGKFTNNPYDTSAGTDYRASDSVKVWKEGGYWCAGETAPSIDVVKIGETPYTSLEEAVAAIGENGTGTIQLTEDLEISADIEIPSGATVRIELNSHDITGVKKIVNYGTLEIGDSSNFAEGKGSFVAVENYGALTICYGNVNGDIVAKSGSTVNVYNGNCNGQFSAEDGVTMNIRGGIFAQSMKEWLSEDVQESRIGSRYCVGRKFESTVTDAAKGAFEKGYTISAISGDLYDEYYGPSARSSYETDAAWYRYAETRAAISPFANWGIDCTVSFDRAVAQGSVEFNYIQTQALDRNLEKGVAYRCLSPLVTANGYSQITYSRFMVGDPTRAATIRLRNANADENVGTACTLEMRLYASTADTSDYMTIAKRRFVFGSAGYKAMIWGENGGATMFATLSEAIVTALAKGSTVKLVGDCDEDVILEDAGNFVFDANGFAYAGSITNKKGFDLVKGENGAYEVKEIKVEVSVPEEVKTVVTNEAGEEVAVSEKLEVAVSSVVEEVKQEIVENRSAKETIDNGLVIVQDSEAEVKQVKSEFVALLKEEVAKSEAVTADERDSVAAAITETSKVNSYVQVSLKETKVAVTENNEATIKGIVFEVDPVVSVVSEGATIAAIIPNELISAPVTFRLPLTDAFTKNALVQHEGDPDTVYAVQGENGSRYVEVESTHFSEFTAYPDVRVCLLNGKDRYSFESALSEAEAGDVIELLRDITLTNECLVATKVTLNLGAFVLTAASGKNAIQVMADGDLTINATTGGIDAGAGKYAVYTDYENSPGVKTVTINGGVYNGGLQFNKYPIRTSAVQSGEAAVPTTVNLNGGAFKGTFGIYHAIVNIAGGTFDQGLDTTDGSVQVYANYKTPVTITGGKFARKPVGNATRVFVNAGYYDGGYYVIGDTSSCEVIRNGDYYLKATEAFAAIGAGTNIQILKPSATSGIVVTLAEGQSLTMTKDAFQGDVVAATGLTRQMVVDGDTVTYTAWAEGKVAKIGASEYYETLENALADAEDGEIVTVLAPATLGATTVSADVTLLLNGQTVTADGSLLDLAEGQLTISGNGNIVGFPSLAEEDYANLTILGGTYLADPSAFVPEAGHVFANQKLGTAGMEKADGFYTVAPLPVAYITRFAEEDLPVMDVYGEPLDTAYTFDAFAAADKAIALKVINAGMDLSVISDPEELARAKVLMAQILPFANWGADFVVSFDRPVAPGAVALAGAYDKWQSGAWLAFDAQYDIAAGEKKRLLVDCGNAAEDDWTYADVCSKVTSFRCGAYKIEDSLIGTTMTVELRIFDPDALSDLDKSILISTRKYTFGGKIARIVRDNVNTDYASIAAALADVKANETIVLINDRTENIQGGTIPFVFDTNGFQWNGTLTPYDADHYFADLGDGKWRYAEYEYVAKIGAEKYLTLESAAGDVQNGQTIEMLRSVTNALVVARPAKADFSLDLASFGIGGLQVGFETGSATGDKVTLTGTTGSVGKIWVGQADEDDAKDVPGWENRAYEVDVVGTGSDTERIGLGQVYVRTTGTLNITNATATFDYICDYGLINLCDSTLTAVNANFYLAGRESKKAKDKAIITLNNSTLDFTRTSALEMSDGDSNPYAGSGKLVLKNGSTATGSSIWLGDNANGSLGTIAVESIDSALVLSDRMRIGAGDYVSLKNSTVTLKTLVNNGEIRIDATGVTEPVKVIDYTGNGTMTLADYGTVVVTEEFDAIVRENDLWVRPTPNFYVDENDPNLWHIRNLAGLKEFRASCANGTNYEGKTVQLDADINIGGVEWTPIVATRAEEDDAVFDGNGHIVSNFKVTNPAEKELGLFSSASGWTFRNLTVCNATVTGLGHCGAIVGHGMCASFENCTVSNATVTVAVANNDDGDKAGAIVGYLSGENTATVTNCLVANCTITGYRDVGGAVGIANCKSIVVQTTVRDTDIYNIQDPNPEGYTEDEEYNVHEVVGRIDADWAIVKDNTYENVTIHLPNPVAKIGEKTYTTLARAIVAVKDGETIVLLRNNDETINVNRDVSFRIEKGTNTLSGVVVSTSPLFDFEIDKDKGGCVYQAYPAVCAIGETQYSSVEKAFRLAESGDTVKMLANVTNKTTIVVDKQITLDLNGKNVMKWPDAKSKNDGEAFWLESEFADLTITDLSGAAVGRIDATTFFASVFEGHLCISNGNVQALDKGIWQEGGTVEIAGGTLFGATNAVVIKQGALEVSGGTVTSGEDIAIFVNDSDRPNTYQRCSVKISGGTIWSFMSNALCVWYDISQLPTLVTITGGEFKGGDAYAIWSLPEAYQSIQASGGLYTTKPFETYVAYGYGAVENTDAETKATYPWKVAAVPPIAKIVVDATTTKEYWKLERAVSEVEEGQTIEILADNHESFDVTRTVTFSMKSNGYKLTGLVKPHTNKSDDWHFVVDSENGTCTYCPNTNVAKVLTSAGEIEFPTFAAAVDYVNNQGLYATIRLMRDATISEDLAINRGGVTINLYGKTLTMASGKTLTINGSNVYIANLLKNNRTLSGTGYIRGSEDGLEAIVVTGSDVMAQNVNSTVRIEVGGLYGNIAVRNCTIIADDALTAKDGAVILAYDGTYKAKSAEGNVIYIAEDSETAHIIVKKGNNYAGSFSGAVTADSGFIDVREGSFANWSASASNDGEVLLTGGTYNADPSEFIEEHYCVQTNSTTSYTVKCKYACRMVAEDGSIMGWYEDLETPVAMIRAGTVGVIVLTKPKSELTIPADCTVREDSDGSQYITVYTYIFNQELKDKNGNTTNTVRRYCQTMEQVVKNIEEEAKRTKTRGSSPSVTLSTKPASVPDGYKVIKNGDNYVLTHKIYTCQVVDASGTCVGKFETIEEARQAIGGEEGGVKIVPPSSEEDDPDYEFEDPSLWQDDSKWNWADGDPGKWDDDPTAAQIQKRLTKEGYVITRVKNSDGTYTFKLEVYIAQIGEGADHVYTTFEDAIYAKTNTLAGTELANEPIVVRDYNDSMVAPEDWKFVRRQTGDSVTFHLVAKAYVVAIGGNDGEKYESFVEAIDALTAGEASAELLVLNYNATTMTAPSGWRFKEEGGLWFLAEYVTTGDGKTSDVKVKASGTRVSREDIARVVADVFIAEQIQTMTEVLGVKLTMLDVTNAQGTVTLASGVQRVVTAAKEDAAAKGENDFVETLNDSTNVTIKVDVKVNPIRYARASSALNTGVMSFSLAPTATVVATSMTGVSSNLVAVSNDMIDTNQLIEVSFYTGFKPMQVVHRADDGTLVKEYKGSEVEYNEETGVVTVGIVHFSTLTAAQNDEYMAKVVSGDRVTRYLTLQAAFDAVKAGETVELLLDNVENITVTNKCSFLFKSNGFTLGAAPTVPNGYAFVPDGENNCAYGKIAAHIGEANYLTLKAAFDAVEEGETVTLNARNTETIALAATCSFKFDPNGYVFNKEGLTISKGYLFVPRGTVYDYGPVRVQIVSADAATTNLYLTLSEAIGQVADNETVALTADNGENVTTPIVATRFTFDPNGYEILDGGNVEAAEGYMFVSKGDGTCQYIAASKVSIVSFAFAPDEQALEDEPTAPQPMVIYNDKSWRLPSVDTASFKSETYIFDGWTSEGATYVTMELTPGMVTKDITLVAKFSKIAVAADGGDIEVFAKEGAETTQTRINVTEDWVNDNVKTNDEVVANADVINAVLNQTDPNGLKKWQNYVLGIETNVNSDAAQNEDASKIPVIPDVNPRPDTGFSVKYELTDVTDTSAAPVSLVQTEKIDDLQIDLTTISKSAKFKVNVILTPDGADEGEKFAATNTIGVLKTAAAAKQSLVSVPWNRLGGGDVPISGIVKTANLTPGDKVFVAVSGANSGYYSWTLAEDKTWMPDKYDIYNAKGIKIGEESYPSADAFNVSRGVAIWIQRQDVSTPVCFYGQAVEVEDAESTISKATSSVDPSWNLVASPSDVDLDLNAVDTQKKILAIEGDEIQIPTATTPVNYRFNNSQWCYQTITTIYVGGRPFKRTGWTPLTSEMKIPAGQGFWYLNKDTTQDKSINW